MSAVDDLRSALKAGESETVEFVAPTDRAQLLRTICAFANTRGGVIYMGVSDSSEVVGVDPDQALRHLANLQDHFGDPSPAMNINNIEYPGVKLPVFQVRVHKNENDSPFRYKSAVWRRKGATNMSDEEAEPPKEVQATMAHASEEMGQLAEEDIKRAKQHSATDAENQGSSVAPDPRAESIVVPPGDGTGAQAQTPSAGDAAKARPRSTKGTGVAQSEPPPVTLVGSRMRIQREAAEPEPSLNADEYADVITDILTEAKDDERMSFALFGHWGRGKTYQMGRVQDRLGAAAEKKKLKYSTVLFSAWKYRTTPEMWAYLFETFLQEGRKTSWSLPFRAAFFRQGPWPLITALFGLFFSLWTLTEQVTLAYGLIQLFGVGAALYTVFLFTRFQATAIRLKALYSFAGHADKLGLQAAIGTDLRVLLRAWIPRKTWQDQLKSLPIRPTLSYVLACGLITWKLFPRADLTTHTITFPNFNDATVDAYPWIALGAYAVWILLWTIGPFIVLVDWRKASRDRVLLIVDDLDRCEPGQMLDIIESTMLILDDDEVSKRLQVVMLIDESAFQHALLRKYRYLTVRKQELPDHTYTPERIIRENQEKFFLVHLRLSPLSRTEIDDVTGAFVRQLSGSPPKESLSDKFWGDTTSPEPARSTAVDEPEPLTENASVSSTIELSDDPLEPKEIDHLRIAVTSETGHHPDHTLGPRAIRCLLFRYQLARGILIKLTQKPDPAELAGKVVKAYFDGQRAPEEADTLLDRVVRQVS